MTKKEVISVHGHQIKVEDDFICLSDMVKSKTSDIKEIDPITKWINSDLTIDFLATWESINSTFFNEEGFLLVNKERSTGRPISIQLWVEKTDAKGIYIKDGRNGGVYAHKDIAFEFGTSISSFFKLYLIKEFQRLKEIENNSTNIEWNVRRILSKAHYHVQTEAIKNHKIPFLQLPQEKHFIAYAEEGDILNLSVFGFTSRKWREANPKLASKGENPREYASISELAVIASLEGINAEMIKENIKYEVRLRKLTQIAEEQMQTLEKIKPENSLRKDKNGTISAPRLKNEMFPIEFRNSIGN